MGKKTYEEQFKYTFDGKPHNDIEYFYDKKRNKLKYTLVHNLEGKVCFEAELYKNGVMKYYHIYNYCKLINGDDLRLKTTVFINKRGITTNMNKDFYITQEGKFVEHYVRITDFYRNGNISMELIQKDYKVLYSVFYYRNGIIKSFHEGSRLRNHNSSVHYYFYRNRDIKRKIDYNPTLYMTPDNDKRYRKWDQRANIIKFYYKMVEKKIKEYQNDLKFDTIEGGIRIL